MLEDFQRKSSKIQKLVNRIKSLKKEEAQEKDKISNLKMTAEKLQNKIVKLLERKSDLLEDIRKKGLATLLKHKESVVYSAESPEKILQEQEKKQNMVDLVQLIWFIQKKNLKKL